MFWLKVILYSMLLALAGCGGDSAPNNDNSGGSGGGDTEVTPPTIPPSSKSIRAADFHLTFDINTGIDALNVNFSTFVSSMENKSLSITEIAALSKDAHCQILSSDPKRLQFAVSPKTAKTCVYRYTVTDGIASTEGMGRVTFSASQSNRTQKASSGISTLSTVLPSVSKSTTLGETLTFSLADEFSTELTLMTHPLFSEAIAAYGTGVPIITESGDVTYDAVATGSSLAYFHILDDQNTPDDKSDDIIYNGTLIIDVSGTTNNPPSASDATYSTLIPAGNEIEIDITDFEGSSLIDDVDGDSLQLVAAYTTNAFIELSDTLDVNNTKFKFKSDTFGEKKINYVIYDHNKDGVASGELTLNVGHTLGGKVIFTQYGLGKLFDGNVLGVYSTAPGAVSFYKETIEPYITSKGLTVRDIYPANNWALALHLSDNSLLIFSLIGTNSEYTDRYWKVFPDFKSFTTAPVYNSKRLGLPATTTTVVVRGDGTLEGFSSPNTRHTSEFYRKIEEAINAISGEYSSVMMIGSYNFVAQKEDNSVIVFVWNGSKQEYEQYSVKPSSGAILSTTSQIDDNTIVAQNSMGELIKLTDTPNEVIDYLITNRISIKKILASHHTTAILTNKSDLFSGFNRLYVIDNYKNKYQYVDDEIINIKLGGSFAAYQTASGKLDGLSYEHKIAINSTSPLTDITVNFDLLTDEQKNDVAYYTTSSDALAIIRASDSKVAIVDFTGYTNTTLSAKSIISEYTIGAGTYANENPSYIGRNTFLLEKTDGAWDFVQGVKVDGFIMGKPNFPTLSESPVLIRSNQLLLFSNNGSIKAKGSTTANFYPIDKFIDNGFLFPIADIDNDGLSNIEERESCDITESSPDSLKYEDFTCLNAALDDSDADLVSDSFERMHQAPTQGNSLSPTSYLDETYIDDGKANIRDTYRDIDKNGIIDFLE
ncbi:hypothetical protein O4N73_24520 [Vibrio parahaemolyticus]|uniref:hypothetical protein n=1 Tax=Vibrio parahaemolyticus TaxID=670 RepID=UPI0022B4FB5E|nr:hypothetical protein [Vibrio parahaemolyticus]MCZ6372319.1 hypothetical protein [Vibrio parahaemolyticus]